MVVNNVKMNDKILWIQIPYSLCHQERNISYEIYPVIVEYLLCSIFVRTGPGPTQPHLQRVPKLFPGVKAAE